MLSKICDTCGKTFYKDYNRSKRDFLERARFCSNKCKVFKQDTFYKHWEGKKRPELIFSEASKTMFRRGLVPWNKGKGKGTNPDKVAYNSYKCNAKRKGLPFTVSREDFIQLKHGKCAYCGDPATGIDRVDNTKGYVHGNMVSCCSTCNHMKFNLTKEQFLNRCLRIVTVVGYEI